MLNFQNSNRLTPCATMTTSMTGIARWTGPISCWPLACSWMRLRAVSKIVKVECITALIGAKNCREYTKGPIDPFRGDSFEEVIGFGYFLSTNVILIILLHRRIAVWDIFHFHVAVSRHEFGPSTLFWDMFHFHVAFPHHKFGPSTPVVKNLFFWYIYIYIYIYMLIPILISILIPMLISIYWFLYWFLYWSLYWSLHWFLYWSLYSLYISNIFPIYWHTMKRMAKRI